MNHAKNNTIGVANNLAKLFPTTHGSLVSNPTPKPIKKSTKNDIQKSKLLDIGKRIDTLQNVLDGKTTTIKKSAAATIHASNKAEINAAIGVLMNRRAENRLMKSEQTTDSFGYSHHQSQVWTPENRDLDNAIANYELNGTISQPLLTAFNQLGFRVEA